MASLIGLDVGTTGCKAVLFDEDGTLLASASREYPVELPAPGWAEQDIEHVWALALEATGEAIRAARATEIAAIGLSVHGEAVTPVDRAGQPLRPTILGMDTRTGPQNEWLRERFGAERLFERTGMPIHTINTLPKLLWIREHEPDVWRRADKFLLVEDFLILRMTGHAVTSRCLASRTQMHGLATDAWDEEILQALGLEPTRLATVQPSGTLVGPLSNELTEALGLARPPGVVTGGHDQACAALGVGLTRPGLASVSTGSAEVVEVALATPLVSEPLLAGNISVYQHVVPGLYLAMTLNHSGGLVLRWFRDGFCEPQLARSAETAQDAYDVILAGASPEPSGLLVLPHLSGAGTPSLDTASRGAILGLTFATSRSDIAKAIIEGLTYELRLNLDLLRSGGVRIDVLRAMGGGARSKLWLQLKADVTGITVVTPRITEAAAFGAAILAGVGAGVWPSAADAADRFLELTETFVPEPARHAEYTRLYELYREVYPAIAPISHRL
ncbi:MAG TPA: FGGY family carbohydrate kinase [Candidatus Limnocylindrales bacterium]|nr:FGGY family carbohydrate kinase [Candidatus Limnocylindrales bacterium]